MFIVAGLIIMAIVFIFDFILFLFDSPAHLSVSATAEPLLLDGPVAQLYGRRYILCPWRIRATTAAAPPTAPPTTTPAAAASASHTAHQLELCGRGGAELLPAAVSGADNAAANATATAADAAVGATGALQPQLSAGLAHAAAPSSRLLRPPAAGWRLLRHLYAATHAEHGECLHVDGRDWGNGCALRPLRRPWPNHGIDTPGARRTQDASAAQPIGCGQTVSRAQLNFNCCRAERRSK